MEAKDILGLKINNVTMSRALDTALSFSGSKTTKTIFTPNAEIAMTALNNPSFKKILNSGDMVIPDGAGVVLASKIIKNPLKQKVAGYDLVTSMLKDKRFSDKSFFILGAKPGVAKEAAQNIKSSYPHINIKGTHHGYFNREESGKIINTINKLKPDVLLVALGAPAQEKWIYKNKGHLNVSLAMGIGGTIDVLAGKAKRAPSIFIRLNLEWLYRLIKQPDRFMRMMRIPAFLFNALIYRLSA